MSANPMLGDIVYASVAAVKPELYLALVSLLLLVLGVYRQPRCTQGFAWVGIIALALAGYMVSCTLSEPLVSLNGMFATDGFTLVAKLLVLVSSSLVLLLAAPWLSEGEGKPFEVVILILLATLGMMLMISANDFLALYMALELSSLALYVLASFNRDHAKSSEAGLKYFVLGALASGMLLFGISLIYGFAGSSSFASLAEHFGSDQPVSKAIIVGLVLVIIGFCFKLSAAPFHMWTPDVYEGAPTPVTAFFATAPKVAALALFTRLLLEPFGHLVQEWQQVVVVVSVLSMLVGALAAIMQTNIKRLLAYSSIGHAGFMLMGLAAANQAGIQAMLIYLATYIFMSVGAFSCVLLMKRDGHALEEIKELRGLAQTKPWLAACLALFMFSMAGIPPLAGFFGKFYIVMAVIESGMVWLAVVGVATSVISAYYYIKIVKVMYFDEPAKAFDAGTPCMLRLSLFIASTFTALFFLIPTPLVAHAKIAAEALLK